jgi:type I restriction enzyme S subunit
MNEWKEYLLGDISSMKYGSMPKKELIQESGYPIFSGYRITGYYPKFNCENQEIVVVARGVGGTGDIKISVIVQGDKI